MIHGDARPRISDRARMKIDRRSGRYVLLYPERGLVLSPTAAEIVERCRGEQTVVEIAAALAVRYAPVSHEIIDTELRSFLEDLRVRGLLELR